MIRRMVGSEEPPTTPARTKLLLAVGPAAQHPCPHGRSRICWPRKRNLTSRRLAMDRKSWLAGVLLSGLVCLQGPAAFADVKPHALISEGMVLQQGMKV